METPIYIPLVLLFSIFLVTGCGQDQKPASINQAAIKKYSEATTIEGTVSTGKSLIKTGTVEVTDENGHFRVEIMLLMQESDEAPTLWLSANSSNRSNSNTRVS